MNFNISPAFEKCTEKLPKLAEKRHWKKRKKKNGWKMNRVENRYMTSLCDKLFGAGKKVSGHNWLMWTCTDVIGWLLISVYDTSQMTNCLVSAGWCEPAQMSIFGCRFQISAAGWCQLVDVNLPHRCHWLVDDPRRLCHWRDVTDDPHRLQISVDVTSHPLPLLFSVRNVKNALFASMKYFAFCT